MNKRLYIVDIMRDLVTAVSAELTPKLQLMDSLLQAVNYQYGHPAEILETLKQRDESQSLRYRKYPLVALFTDIEETKGVKGVYSNADITLMVVHHTRPDYKADERLEKSFKPVIHPIVDALLKGIANSPYFLDGDPDLIERIETDRFYLGRQGAAGGEANLANDYLDGTELKMKLRVDPSCIIKPNNTNIR